MVNTTDGNTSKTGNKGISPHVENQEKITHENLKKLCKFELPMLEVKNYGIKHHGSVTTTYGTKLALTGLELKR